ncbi:homeobox protein otx5-A isoform X2 [Nematostella vectensis]|uniref:homeobox protein otx5-A isoform X2 n=1 Tax=Nematostella vectensis TaxID=45351 RepID=UPI0020778391|nr:homeobox protein otx5-A isoform X2 [Nematostella vectensis]
MENDKTQNSRAEGDENNGNTLQNYEIEDCFQGKQFQAQQELQEAQAVQEISGPSQSINQMSYFPSRFFYQYYMPPNVSRSPFDGCGMYGDINDVLAAEYRRRGDKRRRCRTVFSTEQLAILEEGFQKQHFPDNKLRQAIATRAGLPEDRVQVWFQNRRAKEKRLLVERKMKERQAQEERTANDEPQEEKSTLLLLNTQQATTSHVTSTCTGTQDLRDSHIAISRISDDQGFYAHPLSTIDHSKFFFSTLSAQNAATGCPNGTEGLPKYIFGDYGEFTSDQSGFEVGTAAVHHVADPDNLELAENREFVVMDTDNFFAVNGAGFLDASEAVAGADEETVIEELERST